LSQIQWSSPAAVAEKMMWLTQKGKSEMYNE
jgi:hypothetical protein